MSTPTSAPRPQEIVWTLVNNVIASTSLQVVADLGVADHIGDEAVSAKELASACGADADALDRILHLLATYGIFQLDADGQALDVGRERLTARAGDFFVDPLSSADAYILMEVIHDWADAEAAAILTAVRRAASPGARVLVIENVLGDAATDARAIPSTSSCWRSTAVVSAPAASSAGSWKAPASPTPG